MMVAMSTAANAAAPLYIIILYDVYIYNILLLLLYVQRTTYICICEKHLCYFYRYAVIAR